MSFLYSRPFPITFSDNVKKLLQKKKSNSQSWFLDLNLLVNYWGENQQRTYHHTAPTNSLYSLHEALLMLKEEGIENSWFRHYRHHEAESWFGSIEFRVFS